MQRRLVLVAILLTFSTAQAFAAGPKRTIATLTGSVSRSSIASGACNPVVDANGTDDFDSICEHSGSCSCLTAPGLTLVGGFGRGTAILTATEDNDPSVLTGSDENACSPAFIVVTLSTLARGKIPATTQTLNALGAICGTAGTTTVVALGGFSIAHSSSSASGSGTFSGTISPVGQVAAKLTGVITNP